MSSELELLSAVSDTLPLGVVILDEAGRVAFYNRYEEKLAGRSRSDTLGKHFFTEVAPCTEAVDLGSYFESNIGRTPLSKDVLFAFPRPCIERPRDVRLILNSMRVGERHYGTLFVQDVSSVRALERTKDYLVGMLAHDMNNPLTVALSAVELACEPIADPRDLQEAKDRLRQRDAQLQNANESLERVRRMTANLFDITTLQTSSVPIDFVETDLLALIEGITTEQNAMHGGTRATIVAAPSDERVVGSIDANLIERAIVNLLDNAVRYSDPRGEVLVSVRRDGRFFRITVRDHGPGIPPELRRKIFRPFVRHAGEDEENGHRGLGLALVELVAREHGGGVSVDCPPIGGSIFELSIPVSQKQRNR